MRLILFICVLAVAASAQIPPIEPGVSEELAKWRSTQYSNISYKLNLTLEKMSPVLRGSMEIRVTVGTRTPSSAMPAEAGRTAPIILDWRNLPGYESVSTVSNVSLNGKIAERVSPQAAIADEGVRVPFEEHSDHLIFRDGVKMGENVIKLDFTSPILTSGSAITRYIDKEDGSEYIYSLFVPSDASTAFPVFDQPDLKARFQLNAWQPIDLNAEIQTPIDWHVVSNAPGKSYTESNLGRKAMYYVTRFPETKPISTYVFAFAAGPFEKFTDAGSVGGNLSGSEGAQRSIDTTSGTLPTGRVSPSGADVASHIYVRKSQAEKFKSHAAEVFRLNREAVKYLETYFDYKFPWPKYDLVLIPEFPFGGMEHAGATFLREDRIIFPVEPTANDYITRANLIFHEAAHQWFGDLVTMRWFDDLWLKEGFAEFMAYKTLEHVAGGNPTGREGAPQATDTSGLSNVNAWKVFYERNKQAAYATDSTKGTTPIYQPLRNLSAAKSAYGNIVYRKAPSFLRQAEFYLGEDKFQTAVRAFLKKHEFGNAGWEDLVKELSAASRIKEGDMQEWAGDWVKQRGMPKIVYGGMPDKNGRSQGILFVQKDTLDNGEFWTEKFNVWLKYSDGKTKVVNQSVEFGGAEARFAELGVARDPILVFPNYQDYGYGIFLLDDKSRDYVLKNIQNEKDPFLRSMMWGALWDSVREAELDPREYVELVIKTLSGAQARASARAIANDGPTETDETTIQSLLGRASTALNYYISAPSIALANARASATEDLRSRFENLLLDRLQNAPTRGLKATYFRSFVNNASTERSRRALKQMLEPAAVRDGGLRTKDKFDIVTRLAVLGDADAPKLLSDLKKTETSDDVKRYAYAAHAAFATAENKAKFFNDFLNNKDISESWIESALVPFNSIRHADLTQQYLTRALAELPNIKRTRKIFFIGNWLSAFIGGQRDEKALSIINKFLADNPNLDNDLRLKILENSDLIERAIKIRAKYGRN